MKFIDKQLAIKLKEKGFNKPCFGEYVYVHDNFIPFLTYNGESFEELLQYTRFIPAPTIEQTLEWLREKDIMVFPVYSKNTSRWYCEIVNADSLESYKLPLSDSYEDACIAGIEYVINNLI